MPARWCNVSDSLFGIHLANEPMWRSMHNAAKCGRGPDVKALQQDDGSFFGDCWGEVDTRSAKKII